KGKNVGVLIDITAEGLYFKDGVPYAGLTNKQDNHLHIGKTWIPLFPKSKGNEEIEMLVEAGANDLFGERGGTYYLKQAEIVCINKKEYQFDLDLRFLTALAEQLEKDSTRFQKILYGLNECCNVWQGGKGIDKCLEITKELLSKPANASELTVYSIGHAHLDLAWLWPVRETRRKGGRTFATALRMMEEFPEYKFGASQPQLYEWVKKDYPELFKQVQKSVKAGRWECQGAMWVEPDMNISGGEALVRQCLYGKALYMKEFGKDVRNLWLPDVFGYSAALPQILKKSGVDYFMTQKISWNETNKFPHHTFNWEGIDGTRILTHFLPTNDYNLANWPSQLRDSTKRYAQSDVSDEFLNLYGIGDGGAGPGRLHIEFGKRQQDLEGTPKFKFAFAEEFFEKIAAIPAEKLPVWVGELYLEYHRGTYTTQALMKKYNRMLELTLRDVEFLGAVLGGLPKDKMDQIWKDTLLNQFHDILPGSSIHWAYEDAHRMSEENLAKLSAIKDSILTKAFGKGDDTLTLINTLSWDREELVHLERENKMIPVKVPAMGTVTYDRKEFVESYPEGEVEPGGVFDFNLENTQISVDFDPETGEIISIYDNEAHRETLKGRANTLLLWEDKPNNWDAWDINHFYLETKPEQAKFLGADTVMESEDMISVRFRFSIGVSSISQIISLKENSRQLNIKTTVDWKEAHKMLRVRAETAIHNGEALYEIQYGNIKRPTHDNTSWDAAKFETAAHRFADLSETDYGFAILNDCKYGHRIRDNVMELTLLRSPKMPDKEADMRVHEFTFAYLPHPGDFAHSEVLKRAHELNSPLIIHRGSTKHYEDRSYFRIEQNNAVGAIQVKIETVKPAEDGDGTIIRLYETCGRPVDVTLMCHDIWSKMIETNLLEQGDTVVAENTGCVDLGFTPYEIRTFRLVR
ncbi:MAG: alpha-mannosidase, partial [Candidatus Cloacimonetes bacterium]|nr:alpha-mannosidase [Candidatus Cloacimonadota bacterium]